MDLCELTLAVEKIARAAGAEIKRIYQSGDFECLTKEDSSPVTSADYAANDVICAALRQLTPEIPIVSEEFPDITVEQRHSWPRYWLVDPLDGTGEFVAGSGDFAVAIALIDNHVPTIGVIYAPMYDRCYLASLDNGAYRRDPNGLTPLKVNTDQQSPIKIAVSLRQSKETVLSRVSDQFQYQLVPMGSATLKSCLIAEGSADFYMRIGPTGEWDTGAAHCILSEAGGDIKDLSLVTLTYNKRDTLQNPNFIVCGDPDIPWSEVVNKI
ncbi:MAG: 3'(2'),5'-bisphosphate nucleotidase CysQ [Gammaproteobacteria bacterium]|nr:3'(2'),5'-bisphosphate nucleotidase CysQ [Gammaproteobacteria bacterium]